MNKNTSAANAMTHGMIIGTQLLKVQKLAQLSAEAKVASNPSI